MKKVIAALTAEAQAAGLRVDRVELVELGKDSVGSALGQIFGHYQPNHLLLLSLASPTVGAGSTCSPSRWWRRCPRRTTFCCAARRAEGSSPCC
ncbi:MAG: hypothetical protein GW913_09915 [Myxococcales bacterium]|nr:hypothetical protein [Myxococcales bacterium]